MFNKFSKFGKKKDGRKKREPRKRTFRKKVCRFCKDKVTEIDYLEYQKFQRYITERGKIIPSRITGTCAWHQRQLARAVRKARIMALMPFVAE
ncbi:30S ribosomal protein S18 [Candidatus Omnitrophota bacterium]